MTASEVTVVESLPISMAFSFLAVAKTTMSEVVKRVWAKPTYKSTWINWRLSDKMLRLRCDLSGLLLTNVEPRGTCTFARTDIT